MVTTDIHSPGAKVDSVSTTKGMLKPSASTHMKEKPGVESFWQQNGGRFHHPICLEKFSSHMQFAHRDDHHCRTPEDATDVQTDVTV
jgi:hypothetical protein